MQPVRQCVERPPVRVPEQPLPSGDLGGSGVRGGLRHPDRASGGTQGAGAMTGRRLWWPSAAMLAITLLTYVPAMRSGFVWTDDSFVIENPLVHASDGLYRFWFT